MKKPKIFRKRIIPNENIDISHDLLLYRDDEIIITQWNVIRPRKDISWGISYAFLNNGYKISRFYNDTDEFLYWYVDIIEVEYDQQTDTYTFTDLLLDIKKPKLSQVQLLDADELAKALEDELITKNQAVFALKLADELLQMFYCDKFPPNICQDERYLKKFIE